MAVATLPQNGADGNGLGDGSFPTIPIGREIEWRKIPGWPEYLVSEKGDITRVGSGSGAVVGRILRPQPNRKTGYLAVCLCRNGKPVRVDIHRLVALAFHGPQPSVDHLVAHNDGSRTNNHCSNIRWATQSENLSDCRRHGTSLIGQLNPRSRLDEIDVHSIHRMKAAGIPRPVIASGFGLNKRTVFSILSGESWGHIQ